MSIRVMIIDGQPKFRLLLAHHVNTRWPNARITDYDPLQSGPLPGSFAGAGHDLVLLGDSPGVRDTAAMVRGFSARAGFPPIVFFAAGLNEATQKAVLDAGASACLGREKIAHRALVDTLDALLREDVPSVSTQALFEGVPGGRQKPLLKGYRLVRKLDETDFSAVYRVERERDGRQMALKVLRKMPNIGVEENMLDRFIREYELIASIDHPNIARIENLGIGDQHAHIAMEWLSGGDLSQRIREGLEDGDALTYLRQIAGALSSLHAAGILHLDLKPANIMFRDDGSLALIDFGLARRMRRAARLESSGIISGTPYYMSPEQGHANEIDERADLYSLGIIYHEMLTGRPPYTGKQAMEIIYKHRNAPLPQLPESLAGHQPMLSRLLAKLPADRPASAAEVVRCLS